MADLSTCKSPTCAYTVEGTLDTCPKCGGPMRPVRESRLRGWAMLISGLFLVLLMGAITFYAAPYMLRPGEQVDGGSFSGTPQQARLFLSLFAVIIAFGLVSTVNGAYQIATGRQSRLFTIVGLLFAAAMVVIVFVTLQDAK